MINRLLLYLALGGCALFAAILLAEIAAPAPRDEVVSAVPGRATATRPTVRQQAPPQLDKLVATTLTRPLFSATRRPAPTGKDEDAPDDTLANMRLTGIVTEPGKRLAIFDVSGTKPLAVKEGEELSGWRIEAITPSGVSLTGPGGTKTLQPKPSLKLTRSPARPGLRPRIMGPIRGREPIARPQRRSDMRPGRPR